MKRTAALATCLTLLLIGGAAHAQTDKASTESTKKAGVKAGSLSCKIEGGSNFIVGSSHTLACHFKGGDGKTERYSGSINSYGLDVGTIKSGTLVWGVLAPSRNVQPGALAGSYSGVSAGATAGVGGQANILVGGLGKAISLQPLSIQGQKGVNLTLGVTNLTLKAAP
ncbi:DUF992 domain-containing protein [Flexibacterium corallicola]|uniref:DUF992 domain-containing protein n=1 Tax=Flexibacterium corallicola TaxID=3037259 RepID=UPI00286EE063|nr:DUF992 domain-containing protein [Pseudovibrio sp. M1P-2-3]